jgi:hypothetical protein
MEAPVYFALALRETDAMDLGRALCLQMQVGDQRSLAIPVVSGMR